MPPRPHPGPLSPLQLGELASATLRNALDLLRDAEGLATFGRYPRAYSLAVLAAEEFGKHMKGHRKVGAKVCLPRWGAGTLWMKAVRIAVDDIVQEIDARRREHKEADSAVYAPEYTKIGDNAIGEGVMKPSLARRFFVR